MTLNEWLRDTAERAGTTLIQALAVFIPAFLGPWNLTLVKAVLAALLPVAGAILLNAATTFLKVPTPKSFALDLVYRMLRTFAYTVGAATAAGGFDIFNATAWRALILGALMAAAVVVKGALVKHFAPPVQERITPASLAPAA